MPNNPIISNTPAIPYDYLPFLKRSGRSTVTPGAACSYDLVVALASKGFVILTGQSGTGKSRAAIELGRALDGVSTGQGGSVFEFVSVGADWTDARPLLGYANPFGKQRFKDGAPTHETYKIEPTLRLLLRAAGEGDFPRFVILDEMNLSHVERYFSPFLSVLEANRSAGSASVPLLPPETVKLIGEVLEHDSRDSPEHDAVQQIIEDGKGLSLGDAFHIVGTVNVDETTYMFSPKVLDRAHVIELRSVPPEAFFEKLTPPTPTLSPQQALELLEWGMECRASGAFERHPREMTDVAVTKWKLPRDAVEKLRTAAECLLAGAYHLLEPVGFGFGYRVINEVFAYLLCYLKAEAIVGAATPLRRWTDALDVVFLQKILPKLHGNRRQLGECLPALAAFLNGGHGESNPAAKYRPGEAEAADIKKDAKLALGVADQMPRSRRKLERMQRQLLATGYTTFIQ